MIFVLLSSIASFATGVGINTALAKKSSSNKDGGSGDSGSSGGGGGSSDTSSSSSDNDKGTSSENGGGSSSSTDNTDNSPTPPATTAAGGTEGQTGTTGQEQQAPVQQEQQPQQCPVGQHFDVNQNACVNDTNLAPPSQGLARGDLPPSALETSNNPPASSFCAGDTHYNSATGNCDEGTQQLPGGGCPQGYILGDDGICRRSNSAAAEAAAAAAAGVIDIPPDGKCPPGYHLQKTSGSQKNVCWPNTPIDKSSPEAATRQDIGGSTDTETTSNPTSQTEVRQPNANGGCPPGFHLLPPGFVCVKDVSSTPITRGDLPPSALETSNNPSSSQPECVPGYHWDSSQQQCIADSTGNSNNNPDRFSPDAIGPNAFGQNNIPPNPIGPK